jgi:hypothetical protein
MTGSFKMVKPYLSNQEDASSPEVHPNEHAVHDNSPTQERLGSVCFVVNVTRQVSRWQTPICAGKLSRQDSKLGSLPRMSYFNEAHALSIALRDINSEDLTLAVEAVDDLETFARYGRPFHSMKALFALEKAKRNPDRPQVQAKAMVSIGSLIEVYIA